MSHGPYDPLLPGPDSIRLLRIMPDKNETAPIRCELCRYSLQESGKGSHLYEVLSYVWGDPDNVLPIFIAKYRVYITKNLYAVLLRLRDYSFERIIWVDAICINQADDEEKGNQIGSIAKIYGQAKRVIVWLGEAADHNDGALETIRAAGKNADFPSGEKIHRAILQLLQRPWFRRIWALQEVAAARHVLISCGTTDIDGYAFCSGFSRHMLSKRVDRYVPYS
ncbi:heterokaryon incompatibility protein-domain-containing protein [Bisporella sp. PMI_857]|nr:heterokaryon incompatibility protein-domain-containing protein [Bisporella sp. PMI_857]